MFLVKAQLVWFVRRLIVATVWRASRSCVDAAPDPRLQ